MNVEFKSIALREEADGRILHLTVHGKLTAADYEVFVPEIERRIQQHGKVRMLVELQDFQGWSAGAAWEDVKFDLRHWNDIERLAVVGEGRFAKGVALFAKPFTRAEVRFFEHADRGHALRWLQGLAAAEC